MGITKKMDTWHFDDCFGEKQRGTQFENESNDVVKEAIIFLIDVASPEMHQGFDDPESNDTKLQMALKCVHATLRRKILDSPNDLIGVLLYGTERKICVNDFENLSLILPLDKPEGKSIQQIESYASDLELLRNNVGQCGIKNAKSILEALSQCQSLFSGVQVSTRRILLFTTNDNPYLDSHLDEACLEIQAAQTGSDLTESRISLEIIPLSTDFDFSKFYAHVLSMEESAPTKRFSIFRNLRISYIANATTRFWSDFVRKTKIKKVRFDFVFLDRVGLKSSVWIGYYRSC